MEFRFVKGNWETVECDVFIAPLFQDEPLEKGLPSAIDKKLEGLFSELKDTREWQGKAGQMTIIYRPAQLRMGRLILLGAGEKDKFDSTICRNLTWQVIRRLKRSDLKSIAFYQRGTVDAPLLAQAVAEGVILATYEGDDYKTEEKSKCPVQDIQLITEENLNSSELQEALRRGEVVARATNLARLLTNEPGNRLNPSLLAKKAHQLAQQNGLEIEVFDEAKMEKKGMNGLLAVAQGSDEPPRFIILKHFGAPDRKTPPIVLVGKGVTFDSGGLSLKPSQSMEEMKTDKAGACSVLGAMQAIAQLQLQKNVIGLIAAVENLPSGRAQRPGDVIRSMSGKTVEVINTDAEGRIILADALHYAQQLQPECVLDIATLTGACIVALGHIRAGLFCNSEDLYQRILTASDRAGEKFWRLPLDDEYGKEIKSEIADIKNMGSRWGGAITAAKFLQEFIGDTPWCHIDMAGVDLFREGREAKGATGFGVRTFVALASQ